MKGRYFVLPPHAEETLDSRLLTSTFRGMAELDTLLSEDDHVKQAKAEY